MKRVVSLTIRLQESYEITSDHLKICQILFSGTADGDYFHGEILPGAVDTQRIYPDGSGELSARYTLLHCRGKIPRGTDALYILRMRRYLEAMRPGRILLQTVLFLNGWQMRTCAGVCSRQRMPW